LSEEKYLKFLNKPMETILIIRHRFIGDTLLMLPMLAALRHARPHAHITVMTAPDSAPLLTHCPHINERWVFGVNDSVEGQAVPNFWAAVKRARQQRFTAALILKRSLSSAALPFLAGIRVRIGFATEGRRLLLTHALPYKPDDHEADGFMSLLQAYLGEPPPAAALPAVWFAPGEETALQTRWLPQATGQRHLGFHVGASNTGKQWPLPRFVDVAQGWLGASPTHQLHIFGGPGDVSAAQAVVAGLSADHAQKAVIWAGQLGLRETAYMLKQLDFLVTSDSGLSHLAAAVGTPVRVVFGPTNPQKWHPLGQGHQVITTGNPPACMPCNLKVTCQLNHVCLSDVSANDVLATLI
jgi:heptosyltransferase II